MKIYVYLTAKDYVDPASVVPAIIEDWMDVTSDGTPVVGWPARGCIRAYFRGHIPLDEQGEIKALIMAHFNGDNKACLFPIKEIEIMTGEDDWSGEGVTAIKVMGDRDRAQEMLRPATL